MMRGHFQIAPCTVLSNLAAHADEIQCDLVAKLSTKLEKRWPDDSLKVRSVHAGTHKEETNCPSPSKTAREPRHRRVSSPFGITVILPAMPTKRSASDAVEVHNTSASAAVANHRLEFLISRKF